MLTMNGKTYDLRQMKTYDAKKSERIVSLTQKQISFKTDEEINVGEKIIVHLNEAGTVIAFTTGKDGFEVKACGYKAAGRGITCKNVIEDLIEKGAQIPQKTKLYFDANQACWYAEIKHS